MKLWRNLTVHPVHRSIYICV